MEKETLRKLIVLSFSMIGSLVISIIILFISFQIIIYFLPSEIILENGEKSMGQPFLQFFISAFIGIISFVAISILGFTFLNKRILLKMK